MKARNTHATKARQVKTMHMRRSRQHGLSLVEVLIASAILAFAVAAITQAISSGQMQTAEALHNVRAMALVEAMLEEIESKPYADPEETGAAGPEAGESDRDDFDNADDYHGYTETTGNCVDADLAAYGGRFDVFARAVTCVYGTETIAAFGGAINGLHVTVTVTDTRSQTWTSTRFIPEPQ
jgi:MSHA pilin protein MshD